MIGIGLLGPFFLRIDGRDAGRLAKKGRALIAYLALNRTAAVGRERLADLLWPEQDSDHARHGLRNCLLQLRSGLPDTERWLIADGEGLRLQPDAIEVDADRFLALAGSESLGDLAAAAPLYRGELLADLAVQSEPFEAWVVPERARLQAAACKVLERLATAQAAAGQAESAIATARRLVALERFSEEGHRLLMGLYAQSGRRVAAISQYRTFVALLREELGVGPDAETEALARRIQSQARDGPPNRPVREAPVAQPAAPPAAGRMPVVAPAEREETPCWPVLPRLVVGVAALRNLTGDRSGEMLGEAISEDLATDLATMGRSFAVTRSRLAAGDAIADPKVNSSGLDYVLSGSVQDWKGLSRISAYLIDAASGQYVWARRYDCRQEDSPNIREDIARTVAQELQVMRFRVAGTRGLADAARDIGPSGLIERGTAALMEQNTPAMLCKAQQSFLQVLALSPDSADALIGLAWTYQRLMSQPWCNASLSRNEPYELGRQAALAALRLDPDSTMANNADGMLLSGGGEVEQAAAAFERTLAIDPRQPIALSFGGYNAAFLGRAVDTLARVELALRVDRDMPDHMRSISYFFAGVAQVLLGRTEEAIGYLDKSLSLNPSYESPQLWLCAAHMIQGDDHKGRLILDAFRDRVPRYRLTDFAQQWITRSSNEVYRRQVDAAFAGLRAAGLQD